MKWRRPKFSGAELRRELRKAEHLLRTAAPDSPDRLLATEIVNDWRISHQFPLNVFQTTLRSRARIVGGDPLVVQRIKKMETIESKIGRVEKLELWDMQDIGGCRAILRDVAKVRELAGSYKASTLRHRLKRTKDYIEQPKADGYRGIHLVHVYQHESEDHAPWTGCQIEIQIRTQLQHAWAAAIETVDLFDEQTLKFGGGSPEWRRLFFLMSEFIAQQEASPSVPGAPTDLKQISEEVRALEAKLSIRKKFDMWSFAVKHAWAHIRQKDARFFVLNLDLDAMSITVSSFGNKKDNQEAIARAAASAAKQLLQEEAVQGGRSSVVLVGARSLKGVKAAFPAYFADTKRFTHALNLAMAGQLS